MSLSSAFTVLIRQRYSFVIWLVIFAFAFTTSKVAIDLVNPLIVLGIELFLLVLLLFSIFYPPIMRLLLFKIASRSFSLLIQSKYAILCWIAMTILTAYGIAMWGTSSFLFMISFTFMVFTIIDRMIYKRVTPYVTLDRIQKTLHMTMSIRIDKAADLRSQFSTIVEDFVASLNSLPSGKTYTIKTHQKILDELLKHGQVEYKLVGTGVVYEKTSLLPLKAIFDPRLRRRFLLKKENKYKVKVTL
jgi:hypothetical protein